jgi:hypothetical protein
MKNETYNTISSCWGKETGVVKESGFKRFPPRLGMAAYFYAVLNREYAEQIAKQWNTEDEFSGFAGHVLSFDLPEEFFKDIRKQNVGGEIHNELWVPANELKSLIIILWFNKSNRLFFWERL